jgi:hypothetical protein
MLGNLFAFLSIRKRKASRLHSQDALMNIYKFSIMEKCCHVLSRLAGRSSSHLRAGLHIPEQRGDSQ